MGAADKAGSARTEGQLRKNWLKPPARNILWRQRPTCPSAHVGFRVDGGSPPRLGRCDIGFGSPFQGVTGHTDWPACGRGHPSVSSRGMGSAKELFQCGSHARLGKGRVGCAGPDSKLLGKGVKSRRRRTEPNGTVNFQQTCTHGRQQLSKLFSNVERAGLHSVSEPRVPRAPTDPKFSPQRSQRTRRIDLVHLCDLGYSVVNQYFKRHQSRATAYHSAWSGANSRLSPGYRGHATVGARGPRQGNIAEGCEAQCSNAKPA